MEVVNMAAIILEARRQAMQLPAVAALQGMVKDAPSRECECCGLPECHDCGGVPSSIAALKKHVNNAVGNAARKVERQLLRNRHQAADAVTKKFGPDNVKDAEFLILA